MLLNIIKKGGYNGKDKLNNEYRNKVALRIKQHLFQEDIKRKEV